MILLKLRVYFPASVLKFRVLLKLTGISGDYLYLSSRWSSFSEKLFFCKITLVKVISTDTKRDISSNTLGLPSIILSISWTLMFCLSPEMRIFPYSGTSWEDYEVTSFYYPLDWSRVDAISLNSVGSCTLLEFLTWLLCHVWIVSYTVDGFGVSDMEHVSCNDAGSSVMLLGESWVLGPVGRSWYSYHVVTLTRPP